MENNILKQLGLNDKEITIYLFLNKNKVQTVKQISDSTGINRTTVYRHLNRLQYMGLVRWIIEKHGTCVQAALPEALQFLFNTKKRELNTIEADLPALVTALSQAVPSAKFATQIRYYQGQSGIQQLFWNTLKTTETTRSYAPMRRREFIDPEFEDKLEAEWTARELRDKVITNKIRVPYIKNKLLPSYKKTIEFRFIPQEQFYITNDIIIYNNIYAIASLEKGNLVGVEIENPEIARTQKSIFDVMWKVAKSLV